MLLTALLRLSERYGTDQPLCQELEEAGYNKQCKVLQKRHVALIVKHLDEP